MKLFRLVILAFFLSNPYFSFADSATWKANPGTNDWNTAANWDPEVIPTDVATFATSSVTDVAVAFRSIIGTITFAPGADSFTIRTAPGGTASPTHGLTINGAGVVNDSAISQTLISGVDANNDGVPIVLLGGATIGPSITLDAEANSSGSSEWGAAIDFNEQSSAGDGVFHARGSAVAPSSGGTVNFFDQSSAGRATLISEGASVSGAGGGTIWFWGTSTADDAVITAEGGQ